MVAPSDPELSIPFSLKDQDSRSGGRLGGHAPSGVHPRRRTSRTTYLATIPVLLAPSKEVSIFITEEHPEDVFTFAGRVLLGDLGPVETVLHDPSVRGSGNLLRSNLSGRALVLAPEQPDWYISGEGERVVLGRHKIGGRAAVFRDMELEEVASRLLLDRFSQVLQLDFPGPEDDPIHGSWPFGDGMFHLFARDPFGLEDWACFWET